MKRQGSLGRFVALLAFSLVFTSHTGRGQTTGSISGRVSDPAGSALPGVTVEATSSSLQGTRTAVTDRNGAFRFPAVPPGAYRIQATLSGFRAAEKTATVSLDTTATVDLTLQLATEEQVVVTGAAPFIDITATTTGTNYTSNVISHLPVARNYADIVRANPGVSSDRGETQGRSLALTIYGATSAENQWIIDGVNTTNVIKGMQGKAINNEFVQEVEVKTGGYQAEYGRALGGVINVVTKSGGNQFHGDGFLYYDGNGWTANPVVALTEDELIAAMRIDSFSRTDFGADLGGFLVKDRLWFFAAYDRVDLSAKLSRYVSTDYVSSSDQFPLTGTDNLYSAKLTWNASSQTTLVGTVFADPTSNTGAAGSDPRQGYSGIGVRPVTNRDPTTWYSTRNIGAVDFGARLNQLFGSRALLTVQGSRHQDQYSLVAPDLVRTNDFTCQGGTPDEPCGEPPVPNVQTGGYGFVYGPTNRNRSSRDQYRGDLNLYLGNHEVKLGADYMDANTNAFTYFSGGSLVTARNGTGVVYYQHQFYAVSPQDLTPVSGVTVRPRTGDVGAYIQDSWKPAAGWTVNVGLRWDEESIQNYLGQTVIRTTNEWQPRIGIVWDPWKDGTTKISVFAGRFSYALPTDLAARSYGASTSVSVYNFDPSPSNLTQNPNVPGHQDANISGGAYGTPVDGGLRGIYQDEYTIGVERLFGPTLTVGLKGTYRSLGNVIEDRCNLDYNSPETNYSSCGIVNPGSNGRMARGDIPGCTGLDDYSECTDKTTPVPAASRIYRGIELFARKSLGDQFWLQASYVYSSLRGNYDGEISEGYFGQTDPGINQDFDYPALFHNAYGRLYLDRPQRFRFDGYYTTPFRLWVGLQAFVFSGAPLNKYGYFNGLYGPAIQLVPRGYAGRLPTEWEGDLTLGYPIAIGPVTVTLEAYVFNFFNNQIATSKDTSWTTGPPPNYPDSLFDPNQPQSPDSQYGKITSRQQPRSFRAAVKVSF